MFNRYWRSYPWYIQLVQFIALELIMVSFFVLGLTPVILKAMAVSPDQIIGISTESPRNVINAAMLLQLSSALGIFLFPALLYAYFAHPRPAAYLGLRKPGRPVLQISLAIILMLSVTPLLLSMADFFSRFDLGSMQQTQESNDRMVKAFLQMNSPGQLFFSFFVMAILPGLSEELFFRGLLLRFSARRSVNYYLPVWVAALIFAAMHSNIYGFPSIFIAGVLLGFFYLLTGSVWVSVVAHACYNGMQVLFVYFFSMPAGTTEGTTSIPWWLNLSGIFVALVSGYCFWKFRTPLPIDWADDYTKEELAEEQGV